MAVFHGRQAVEIGGPDEVGGADDIAGEGHRHAAQHQGGAAEQGVGEEFPQEEGDQHGGLEGAYAAARVLDPDDPGTGLDGGAVPDAGGAEQPGKFGAQGGVDIGEPCDERGFEASRPGDGYQEEEHREGEVPGPAAAAQEADAQERDADGRAGEDPAGEAPCGDDFQGERAEEQPETGEGKQQQGRFAGSGGLRGGPGWPPFGEQGQAEEGNQPAESVMLVALPECAQPIDGVGPEREEQAGQQPAAGGSGREGGMVLGGCSFHIRLGS